MKAGRELGKLIEAWKVLEKADSYQINKHSGSGDYSVEIWFNNNIGIVGGAGIYLNVFVSLREKW